MFAGQQRRRSSNVRAMQLFHELKQQFPTIPDQIVTSCISSYVQSNAQGSLIQLIETAIADNRLEQMGRPAAQQQAETAQENAAEESVNESVEEVKSDHNSNLVRTTAAKRPDHLDIKPETLPDFQEKRQFNIQLSEKCKDVHRLLNSSARDKPPRSPIGAKRVAQKNSPTKPESHDSPVSQAKKEACGTPTRSGKRTEDSQEAQPRLSYDSPTGQSAVGKRGTSPSKLGRDNRAENPAQLRLSYDSPSSQSALGRRETCSSPSKPERASLLSPHKRTENLQEAQLRLTHDSPVSQSASGKKEVCSSSSRPEDCQELQRRLGHDSPLSQGSVGKKETCSTPTQTTDTLLGNQNVNVSLNVNCSVDVQSRRALTSVPRNITSVNFTVGPPPASTASSPATPGGSGVTYSTSSVDPQKRVQSRLQITVGAGTKVRPRSFHLAETAAQEVVPVRAAGSLNDLVESSESPVILKQQQHLERLRAELNSEKAKLEEVKRDMAKIEKERLERQLADDDLVKQLLRDIKHLRYQCKELQSDGEAFYRNIYTGQRGPLTLDVPLHQQLRATRAAPQPPANRQRLQYQQRPQLFRQSTDEEGPKWNCDICTFLNHPDLDKCEQCDMPRIVHGTNADSNTLKLLKATRSLSLIPVPSSHSAFEHVTLNIDNASQVHLGPGRIVTSSRSTPNMFGHNDVG